MRSTDPDAEVAARPVRLPRPRTASGGTGEHRAPRAGKVAVLGLDAVGLSLAVRAAELGRPVVGLDTDARRLQALRVRRSYVEGIADARLRALGDDVFTVTSDEAALDHFDTAVIVLPPTTAALGPDLPSVEAAATAVGRFLLPGAQVLLEPASCGRAVHRLVTRILEQRSGLTAGVDFHLGVGVSS